MRKLIIGLGLAVATIGATVVDTAQAEGRFEMSSISVNGGGAGVYQPGRCVGRYAVPVGANSVISNVADDESTIRVAQNRRGANVTCRFTDTSGSYEADAEVGYTDNCIFYTEDGAWRNGIGTITAAANNATDGSDGGNVMIHCRFETGDFTPNP